MLTMVIGSQIKRRNRMAYVAKKYTIWSGENLIGIPGQSGFGVGVCPSTILPCLH